MFSMCICLWKIYGHLLEWLQYKIGYKKTENFGLFFSLICITLSVAFGQIALGIVILFSFIAMCILTFFINKSLVHQYMHCYWACKDKDLSNHFLGKYRELMNTIWEMSTPKVQKKITKVIEKEEKLLKHVNNEHKTV